MTTMDRSTGASPTTGRRITSLQVVTALFALMLTATIVTFVVLAAESGSDGPRGTTTITVLPSSAP